MSSDSGSGSEDINSGNRAEQERDIRRHRQQNDRRLKGSVQNLIKVSRIDKHLNKAVVCQALSKGAARWDAPKTPLTCMHANGGISYRER